MGEFARGCRTGLPIVVHPDAPYELDRWRQLGSCLTIENMDLRKGTGRFADELRSIFAKLPEARLCLDLAHSRQTDPTMTECFRKKALAAGSRRA